MARFASINKMGYFPIPEHEHEFVLSRLALHEKQLGTFRLMDVGCGEGEILHYLQKGLAEKRTSGQKVLSYGVELDIGRAQRSAKVLDHVVNCSYDRARLKPHNAMSFLWLNPPYQEETSVHESARTELIFVRNALRFLQPGGVFAFCIPQGQYSESMAKAIAARCNSVQVYRFTNQEYSTFKQTVLFAYRGRRTYAEEKSIISLLKAVSEGLELPALDEVPDVIWTIPMSKSNSVTFRSEASDPRELAIDLENSPLIDPAQSETLYRIQPMTGKRPILPLRLTHLAQIISAGAKDGTVGVPMLFLEAGCEAFNYMRSLDDEHYDQYAETLEAGEIVALPLTSVRSWNSEEFQDGWGNSVPFDFVTDQRHYISGGTKKVTDVEVTEDEDGNPVKTKTQRLVSVGRAFLPTGEIRSLD